LAFIIQVSKASFAATALGAKQALRLHPHAVARELALPILWMEFQKRNSNH